LSSQPKNGDKTRGGHFQQALFGHVEPSAVLRCNLLKGAQGVNVAGRLAFQGPTEKTAKKGIMTTVSSSKSNQWSSGITIEASAAPGTSSGTTPVILTL
jgi:hypothetical protein